jgi:hypothetical protein
MITLRRPLLAMLLTTLAGCGIGEESNNIWIMWAHGTGDGRHAMWEQLKGYKTLQECLQETHKYAQWKRTENLKTWGDLAAASPKADETPAQARAASERDVDAAIIVKEGRFWMNTINGAGWGFNYVCWAAGTDPRESKGK